MKLREKSIQASRHLVESEEGEKNGKPGVISGSLLELEPTPGLLFG
jgi:hypothetical protein